MLNNHNYSNTNLKLCNKIEHYLQSLHLLSNIHILSSKVFLISKTPAANKPTLRRKRLKFKSEKVIKHESRKPHAFRIFKDYTKLSLTNSKSRIILIRNKIKLKFFEFLFEILQVRFKTKLNNYFYQISRLRRINFKLILQMNFREYLELYLNAEQMKLFASIPKPDSLNCILNLSLEDIYKQFLNSENIEKLLNDEDCIMMDELVKISCELVN